MGYTDSPPPAQAEPDSDAFTAIERLGALHDKGLVTEQEFTEKKAELLARL